MSSSQARLLAGYLGERGHPVAVRYACSTNPEGANLYNRNGLPASPFRTDNW